MNKIIGQSIFSGSGGMNYDAAYGSKDYHAEACKILEILRSYFGRLPGGMLDVGCGTGRHLRYFPSGMHIVGMDISSEQLNVARERLPQYDFRQGDMRDFDLHMTFDAVICIFSSIAYLETYEELERAVQAMSRHLVTGGVLIIEPWVTKEKWSPARPVRTQDYRVVNDVLSRQILKSTDGDHSVLDMRFVLRSATGEVKQEFSERHKMRLCFPEEYERAYSSAGLDASYYEDKLFERGLYIGVKG